MASLLKNHTKFVEVFCHNATLKDRRGCRPFYFPIDNFIKTKDGLIENLKCPKCQGHVFTQKHFVHLAPQKLLKVKHLLEEYVEIPIRTD